MVVLPDTELLHDLLDHRAELSPHAPAVTAAGQTRSCAEPREASLRLAGWLSTQRIGRHDRVVIVLPASVHVAGLIHAASRLGAPFCVLHEQVHGPALDHVLDDLEPGLLVTADQGAAAQARSRGIVVADASDIAAAAQGTVLAAMPAIAETLLWLLRRSTTPPAALSLVTTTGAAMPAHIATELRSLVPGLRVQIRYGLTECKRVAIMPPDEDLRRPGASGLPLPGTEVLVVDPDGEPLRPGELGEFVVRGPHVMAGYWRRESLTAERFPATADGGRELRTGDFGRLDEDGYLYVEGRRDDVYKERGFRVSTAEIEAAAHELPGVRLAVVLPPRATARPHAVLGVSGSSTPKDVMRDLIGERRAAW